MLNIKHTPGPWKYEPRHDGLHWTDSKSVMAAEVDEIAVLTRGLEYGVADANARLIAAAPELLEALKNMVEWASGDRPGEAPVTWHERVMEAKRAIGKAEGHQW